jgi:hypothetical protein
MTRKYLRDKTSPRLDIAIPQDIIDTSAIKDSSHCMIAEAVKRAVPNAAHVSVDLATIRFTDLVAGVRYVYLTPRVAQEALLAFDQGEKPEPFKIRLQNAHVVATGTAQKARAHLEPNPKDNKKGTPIRVGGKAPPIGPLSGGTTGRPVATNRRGRRREFGLRAIIR